MWELVAVVEAAGTPNQTFRAKVAGDILYRDEWQVVAKPRPATRQRAQTRGVGFERYLAN